MLRYKKGPQVTVVNVCHEEAFLDTNYYYANASQKSLNYSDFFYVFCHYFEILGHESVNLLSLLKLYF